MFDVETVFLFSWAVVVQDLGIYGLVSILKQMPSSLAWCTSCLLYTSCERRAVAAGYAGVLGGVAGENGDVVPLFVPDGDDAVGAHEFAGCRAVSYTHLDVYKRQLALFSLAGIPPFAGFFSKFFVFAAAFKGCLLYTSRCV